MGLTGLHDLFYMVWFPFPLSYSTCNFALLSSYLNGRLFYYHLCPSMKCDEFCAKFYFSNVNGLCSRVSLLTNETLAVMF